MGSKKENKNAFKHGEGKGTNLYRVWSSIKDRCLNPNHKFYYRYGGRGITVCDDWNEIRELHNTGKYTYKDLTEKYNISYSIIKDVLNNKTWKA